MSSLTLRNPHAVLTALQHRPQDVTEIQVARQTATDAWKEVARLAQTAGVAIRQPPPVQQQQRGRSRDDGGRTGGSVAFVRPREGVSLEQLYAPDAKRGVWLALDCIQDPHNVGAIFRTAAFFGIKGIVLTQDRSAPLSSIAYDVASGGLETTPFSLQTNLSRAIDAAKKQDMWVLGSSEHAPMDIAEVDRDRRWLLVLGNEEKGIRRLTQEKCDQLCCIPCRGEVTSLNVSVAAGVLLAHLTQS